MSTLVNSPEPAQEQPFTTAISTTLSYWLTKTEPANQASFDFLYQQRRNIYKSIHVGLNYPKTVHAASQLISQLRPFIEKLGVWNEYIVMLEKATELEQILLDLKLNLKNHLGYAYLSTQKLDRATVILNQVIHLAKQNHYDEICGNAYLNLGVTFVLQMKYGQARDCCERARSTFSSKASSYDSKIAALNNLMGLIEQGQGNLVKAQNCYLAAANSFTSLDDTTNFAKCLGNASRIATSLGDYNQALNLCDQVIDVLERSESKLHLSNIWLVKGDVYYEMTQYKDAEYCYKQANSTHIQMVGNVYLQAFIFSNLGNVYRKRVQWSQSEAYLRKALIIWDSLSEYRYLGWTYGCLGKVKIAQGVCIEGKTIIQKAMKLLSQVKSDAWVLEYMTSLKEALNQCDY